MNLTVEYSTDEFYRICFGHAVEQTIFGKDVKSHVDDYGDYTSCVICETKPPNFGRIKGETQMAKLEVSVLVGKDSKEWLAALTEVVDRIEAVANVAGKTTGKKTATTAAEADYNGEADEDAKPAKRAAKKNVDEDQENFDLGSDEVAEGNEDPITIKEVIAACRANRETAIKVLKKLKVNSVHELKPAQYAKVMSEIGA